jgi:hypothetical protein
MNLVAVSELFEVCLGTNLDLNALEVDATGIPFVSRTSRNNGVSAMVRDIKDVTQIQGGSLSVALVGNPMQAFFQPEPFYSSQNILVLRPKQPMTRHQMLYYAACLCANKFKFSYGRVAHRGAASIMVPSITELPSWVSNRQQTILDTLAEDGLAVPDTVPFDTKDWKPFKYTDLFDIVRGQGPSLADAKDNPGPVPYVTASDMNNGVATLTSLAATHGGCCLTVAKDGAPGAAFFQPAPFCANTHVHVLQLRQGSMTLEIGLYLATLVRLEMRKYSFGRAWGLGRMQSSEVRLPVNWDGTPDWGYMQTVVQALPSHLPLRAVGGA